MNSSLFKSFTIILFFIILFIIFIFAIFLDSSNLAYSSENISFSNNSMLNLNFIDSYTFSWPTPDYYTITSYFGYRAKPTSGASNYHSGIDIAAPTRF